MNYRGKSKEELIEALLRMQEENEALRLSLESKREPKRILQLSEEKKVILGKNAKNEIQLFRTIADQASYATAISTLQGNIIYANKAYAKLLGLNLKKSSAKTLTRSSLPNNWNKQRN